MAVTTRWPLSNLPKYGASGVGLTAMTRPPRLVLVLFVLARAADPPLRSFGGWTLEVSGECDATLAEAPADARCADGGRALRLEMRGGACDGDRGTASLAAPAGDGVDVEDGATYALALRARAACGGGGGGGGGVCTPW